MWIEILNKPLEQQQSQNYATLKYNKRITSHINYDIYQYLYDIKDAQDFFKASYYCASPSSYFIYYQAIYCSHSSLALFRNNWVYSIHIFLAFHLVAFLTSLSLALSVCLSCKFIWFTVPLSTLSAFSRLFDLTFISFTRSPCSLPALYL